MRTKITRDMWEALNSTWLAYEAIKPAEITAARLPELLDWIRQRTALFRGALLGTILRDDGYYFSQLGAFVERADNTARILDVKYFILLPSNQMIGGEIDTYQWETILRSVSAHRAYRHVFHENYRPWNVADFLILHGEMPRSLRFSYDWLSTAIEGLCTLYGTRVPSADLVAETRNMLMTLEHGHDLPGRPARIPDRLHRAQQPADRRRLGRLQFRSALMRISIRHSTHYSYDAVGSFAVQRLRLTPFDNQAQKVLSWAIEADGIADAAHYIDGFGNRVHLISHSKPYEELTITATGEVETFDQDGVRRQSRRDRQPAALPALDAAHRILRLDRRAGRRACRPAKMLDRLHHLLEAIADRVTYVTDATNAATSAVEAFDGGAGGLPGPCAHLHRRGAQARGSRPLRDRLPARRRRGAGRR